jgi:hypothetical protein
MSDNEGIFKTRVIILLTKEPDPESTILDIQDFEKDGRPFIPVFSSMAAFAQSTRGSELPYPKYQIDGLFLLSLLNGNETLRVNATLSDEAYFQASDLKAHYKTDIQEFVRRMNSEK